MAESSELGDELEITTKFGTFKFNWKNQPTSIIDQIADQTKLITVPRDKIKQRKADTHPCSQDYWMYLFSSEDEPYVCYIQVAQEAFQSFKETQKDAYDFIHQTCMTTILNGKDIATMTGAELEEFQHQLALRDLVISESTFDLIEQAEQKLAESATPGELKNLDTSESDRNAKVYAQYVQTGIQSMSYTPQDVDTSEEVKKESSSAPQETKTTTSDSQAAAATNLTNVVTSKDSSPSDNRSSASRRLSPLTDAHQSALTQLNFSVKLLTTAVNNLVVQIKYLNANVKKDGASVKKQQRRESEDP